MTDASDRQLLETPCLRYEEAKGWRDFSDIISPEVPLHLSWPDRERTLWAFPSELSILAIGHALLEWCKPGQRPTLVHKTENSARLEPATLPPLPDPQECPPMDAKSLLASMGDFLSVEGRWDHTGCFHRMALLHRPTGRIIHRTEDIGRHNCIDRISGWAMLEKVHPLECALFISARATASLMAKIARAGFKLVISRSAVTSRAIETAREHDMTLVGFTRINRFTLFTDARNNILVPQTLGETP